MPPVTRGLTSIITPVTGAVKVDVDQFGRVIATHALAASDIPTLTSAKISDFASAAQTQAAAIITANLGVSIQAHDANLDTIAALSPSNGTFIRRTGGVWVGAALVSGDIPNNAANTSGSAGSLSAVLGATAFPALTGDVTTVAGALATTLKPSVTIITPTIASFTNATHSHQNSAGGGSLDAAAIGSGMLALARGGTNADLSASGSSTAFLAQDASHIITSRGIVAADIPTLTASKISDFTSTVNTILASPPAIGGSAAAAGTFTVLTAQNEIISQAATTGSPASELVVTGAAHTALTLSTEYTDVNLNLARTVQFATGAITTQRAVRVQAPTYGFVGASTITNAITLSISGAPVQGTNATLTNTAALVVESGNVGIGTLAPAALLNVSGAAPQIRIDGTLNPGLDIYLNGGVSSFFRVASSANGVVNGSASGDTVIRAASKNILFSVDNGSTAVLLLKSGNVIQGQSVDAATAAVTNVLTITHALTTANAGANGIGTGLLFSAADATSAIGAGVNVAQISAVLDSATDASYKSSLRFSAYSKATGATPTLGLTVGNDGTAATIGLFGVAAIERPTTAIAAASFTANTSGIANDTATWGGYKIGQIVQALINLGALT